MSTLSKFVKKCNSDLLTSDETEAIRARNYLQKRNISESSISQHLVGYCKNNFDIPKELQYYGKEEGDERSCSYFINGRIIVPIYSEFGEPVAFATRKPTFESGNSWWNLSFRKANYLFLLDKARKYMFEQNKVYLVEGYIDALILNQYGLNTVCGLMGTALTPRRIGLIARYCNNICLCLDSDENESGQKAQEKAIFTLKEFGFCENISVIEGIPVGQDPDEFVSKNGMEKLLSMEKKLTEEQINVICDKIRAKNR